MNNIKNILSANHSSFTVIRLKTDELKQTVIRVHVTRTDSTDSIEFSNTSLLMLPTLSPTGAAGYKVSTVAYTTFYFNLHYSRNAQQNCFVTNSVLLGRPER